MKKLIVVLIGIFIIVAGSALLLRRHVQAPAEIVSAVKQNASRCGLTVTTPQIGTLITFPLTVHAVVDNTKRDTIGCSWSVFEGSAGTISVANASGAEVAKTNLTTKADWMTDAPTEYTAVINPTDTLIHGTFTLVFTEDNPADDGEVETLAVPVVY